MSVCYGMANLLEFGRSSLVRSTLAVQTTAQLESIYGEADADTILGQLHNAMIFKHSDIRGSKYWSERLGRVRGIEEKRSYSDQTGSSGSTSSYSHTESVSLDRYDLERVTPSDIRDLPVGTYELGIYGYAIVPLSTRIDPTTGIPKPLKWSFCLTRDWISEHVPQMKKGSFLPYEKTLKPESSYTIKPFEDWEYALLGLSRPS